MAEMIQKTKNQKTGTAYGTKLETPIPYVPKWTEFPDFETMQAAGEAPSQALQLKFVNRRRFNKADQSAKNEALAAAGYQKPNSENDEQVRLKAAYKLVKMTPGITEEQARERASQMLGIEWADEDDDNE
jgi:hypothetical protein